MAKKKFYAVKAGRQTGIFHTWDECNTQIKGFSGALYKSFENESDAVAYLGNNETKTDEKDIPTLESTESYCFVDGSFNPKTKVYGYGGYVSKNGDIHYISGNGNDEEMASMRNVAGEVLGSMAAIKKAIELGIKELTIYYDYMGIEQWATKGWKRNKKGTIAYADFCDSVKDIISLKFVHVYGHTGVEGNEMADKLAKEAVGITKEKTNTKESTKEEPMNVITEEKVTKTLEDISNELYEYIESLEANLEHLEDLSNAMKNEKELQYIFGAIDTTKRVLENLQAIVDQ